MTRGGDIGRDAAGDPGKVVPGGEAGGDLLSVVCASSGSVWTSGGQGVRGGLLVGDLRGIGVDGVDQHGHGQLVQVAVVEDAAARRHLKGALLLLLGALDELLVAHDLEPEEAAWRWRRPKAERRGR